MSDSRIKTIVTIGDGVAAWCLNFNLAKTHQYKVINISANEFFMPCSLNSTSTVGIRGTTPGVSELGDKILASQELFETFISEFIPSGVYSGVEFHMSFDKNIKKFERRYGPGLKTQDHLFLNKLLKQNFSYAENNLYFISPLILKEWFFKNSLNIEYKNEFVTQIKLDNNNQKIIKTLSNEYSCDYVISCSSYVTKNLMKGISEDFDYYLNHSKEVSGSYLEIDSNKLNFSFDKNINLKIENSQLLYRFNEGLLQIGATNINQSSIELAHQEKLKAIYLEVQNNIDLPLPPFKSFKQKTGIRHKGFKRLPFWGEVASGVFSVCGLYKNAFTFAHLASKDILLKLQ